MLEFDILKYAIHKIHSDKQQGYDNCIQKFQKELSDTESELKKSEKKSATTNYKDEQRKLSYFKEELLFALFDRGQQGSCALLHVAVDIVCKELTGLLLDDRVQYSDGNTLLYIALSQGNREIVEMLLDKEPDLVEIKDSCGDMPLHIAVFKGDREIVAILFDTKQDFVNDNNSALLHIAASQENVEVVEISLDIEPTLINVQGKNGNIPLHLAVLRKKVKTVRSLLANKAYRDVPNKALCTPLNCSDNNIETIQLFDIGLSSGVDSLIGNNKTQNNMWTETQVETEEQVAMQKNDIDKNFINKQTTITGTVLHIAAYIRDGKIVKVLLDKEQSLDRRHKYGDAALCIAVSKRKRKVVKILLDKEINLIHKDNRYGEALLSNAKQDENTEIVSVMLAKQEERARKTSISYVTTPSDHVYQDNRTKIVKFFTELFGSASSAKKSEIQNNEQTEKQITAKNDIDAKYACVTEQHALKSTFLKKEILLPLQHNLNPKDQAIVVTGEKLTRAIVNIDMKERMHSAKKKKLTELPVSTNLREVKYDNVSITRMVF